MVKRTRLKKSAVKKKGRMRKLSYDELRAKLKKVEWITSNKMKFESGHKAFDRQTRLISTGNVLGDTQISSFVRPYNETVNPVGEKVPKGELQEYDLGSFKNMPYFVRDIVKGFSKTADVIVYEFRHYDGEKKIIHGYVITTPEYKLLRKVYLRDDLKSNAVVDEASKYVSWVK